jgi:hypothetical protein
MSDFTHEIAGDGSHILRSPTGEDEIWICPNECPVCQRDEARRALLWYGERDCGEALPNFVVSAYESAVDASRAAEENKT